jgi:hypothetical protein
LVIARLHQSAPLQMIDDIHSITIILSVAMLLPPACPGLWLMLAGLHFDAIDVNSTSRTAKENESTFGIVKASNVPITMPDGTEGERQRVAGRRRRRASSRTWVRITCLQGARQWAQNQLASDPF